VLAASNLASSDAKARAGVVAADSGRHFVLASAGCGKTTLLAARLIDALAAGEQPDRMLCLTFTNRAAENMRERAGLKEGDKIFVGNFHQFAIRFLFANKLIESDSKMLDEEDSKLLFEEAKVEAVEMLQTQESGGQLLDDAEKAGLLKQFNLYKAQLDRELEPLGWSPDDLPNNGSREQLLAQLEQVYACYKHLKVRLGCLDFDDLLVELSASLHQYREGRLDNITMVNFDWVQVDEVQDLNSIQWRILHLLASDSIRCLMLFGDYQQAIFSFMGGTHSILAENTRGCEIHRLTSNFRSPDNLLQVLNKYAASAFDVEWSLQASPGRETSHQGELRIYSSAGTIDDEIPQVLKRLSDDGMVGHEGSAAVLLRTNPLAEQVSRELGKLGIGHFKVSGFDLFRRAPVKDAFAYLSAVANPQDWFSWARLWWRFGASKTFGTAKDNVHTLVSTGFRLDEYLVDGRGYAEIEDLTKVESSGRLIVFDTETTGLDPREDRIVQMAALELIDGKPAREFNVYIRQPKSVGETVHTHGITDQFLLENGKDSTESLAAFAEFVGDSPIVAHNSQFDEDMLAAELHRSDIEWAPVRVFDTLDLARRIVPRLKSYRLGFLLDHFKLEGINSHNAIDDVKAAANLMRHLLRVEWPKTQPNAEAVLKRASAALTRFKDRLSHFWTDGENPHTSPDLEEAIRAFFSYSGRAITGYEADLGKMSGEVVKLYSDIASRFPGQLSLSELRLALRHYTLATEADLITTRDKVVVATVHKAKGLEFDTVYLPACNAETSYPHFYSKDPEEVKEEARLFYVGLTRAKRNLILSWHAKQLDRYGRLHSRFPTPFLKWVDRSLFQVSPI
jgi:DNA helicase-2/ATP-dependent DNA helicase PcrA